ncbi:hypothetical protein RQP46_006469 [Phenoliferia psychrophenolica]
MRTPSAAPLPFLNETLITEIYGPDPLSYMELETLLVGGGFSGLLAAHVVAMSLSFFVLLPIALCLKAGRSQLAMVAQGVVVLLLILNAYDVYLFSKHLKVWCFRYSLGTLPDIEADREALLQEPEEAEDFVASPISMHGEPSDEPWRPSGIRPLPIRSLSISSDATDATLIGSELDDGGGGKQPRTLMRLLHAGPKLHAVLMRSMVILGFIDTLLGIIVYSGSCRSGYASGCVDHTSKGS